MCGYQTNASEWVTVTFTIILGRMDVLLQILPDRCLLLFKSALFTQWNYVAHDFPDYDWYLCHPLWPCNYDRPNVHLWLYNIHYRRHRPCFCRRSLAPKHTVIVLSSSRLSFTDAWKRRLLYSFFFFMCFFICGMNPVDLLSDNNLDVESGQQVC